jgi:hypothetical protein
MAFQLKFSTSDYNQGKSLLIQDESTEWSSAPGSIVSVTFTITSLYTGTVLPITPVIKTVLIATVPFEEAFEYEIINVDLGFNSSDTIKDSVYNIIMTLNNSGGAITGAGNTWTSNEVWYFNAMYTRDKFVSEKAAYIDSVYNKDMEYANWLDFLVTGIESNAVTGNTSAIYYIYDIFSRLNE